MQLEDDRTGESPEDIEAEGGSGARKRYVSPHLLEWGSITDLTQGPLLGSKDFPFKGGTRVT